MVTEHPGNCIENVAFGFTNKCAMNDFSAVEYEWIFWLSLATPAPFIALALPRIIYLTRKRSAARTPWIFFVGKLIASIALAGLRLALLILAIQATGISTTRHSASAALSFAASCLLVALSPLEHFKSRRPSILACAYLFLALVYDIARCPLLWSHQHNGFAASPAYNILFTTNILVGLVLLGLEATRRSHWVTWNAEDHSPEETSSILSIGVYGWLNPLLWRGFHEPLTMQRLYALDRSISVEALNARNEVQAPDKNKSTETSLWHLVTWLAKPLGQELLFPVIPRLCLLGFTFCQPFFLEQLLRFLSSHEENSSTASGLVVVAVFTYCGIAVSTAIYWYYQERFQSILRGYLISSIYRKTAQLQHIGEGDNAAVTLMGADVERIYTGLRLIHEMWANLIQIALASWLLQRQLGLAFIAPLIVVLLGFVGSFALSKRAVRYQGAWMKRVQQRIGVTSAVLSRIKDLRISGMTNPASEIVQCEREDEIRVGERSRVLVAVSATLSQLPQAIAPVVAFAFGPHALDATRAFTSLTYLTLLTAPLSIVLQSFPIMAACVACLRRIRVYLIQEERVDQRLLKSENGGSTDNKEKISGEGAQIIIQDGNFGWTLEGFTLKGINLRLPTSSITFAVGPVASGKSTLCRALLGEVPHVQGSVTLGSNKLAYCDQTPFLFNASIKQNITGFSSFDSTRYKEVIEATLLTQDLEALPAGGETIIGSKGVSLSGGQRQRVSLARALYHDADILVLDDVFSGLDGSTQHQVCQSVFGQAGLLRNRGTTAIVCTHSTHLASVADRFVLLSQEGTMIEHGSFAEILDDKQYGERFRLKNSEDVVSTSARSNEGTLAIATEPTGKTKYTELARPRTEIATPRAKKTPVSSPIVDIRVYRYWLSTIGVLPLAFYACFIIGIGFCSNFGTIWIKLWGADSTSPTPAHSFAFWIGIYGLLGAGVVLCVFPGGLIMLRTAVRLSGTNLHRTTVHTIMHSSLRFLSTTDVGKVLNFFSQDMNLMDTQLPRMVNNLSVTLVKALGQAVVIAMSSAWPAVSYPVFLVLLWAIARIYLPTSKRLRILDLEAKAPLYTNFLDTLAGLPTIRAFGWFPYQLEHNNALLNDAQRPVYLLAMVQQWLTLAMNIVVAIIAVMLVLLATHLRSNAGSVGAGLVSLITLGNLLTSVINAYTGLETSLGAISRLKSFGKETEQEDQSDNDTMPGREWPTGGHVQIRNVDASYDGANLVLKVLNLKIEACEKVAICGRTGSGKSSILALLLRLIEPMPSTSTEARASNPPSIVIDDLPLTSIQTTALRERIISLSQDPVFLPDNTSFRTNLDPWAAASDTECTTVLRDLNLSSIVEAKGGLNAPMKGAELSAGQKQLFNLARAVLRRRVKLRETGIDSGLLLLDEITASVDAETERRMMEILQEEFSGYTVVIVTHRREMAMSCDRVIVLDAGKIVEDGRPLELMEREGGWLRNLWRGGN